MFIKTPFDEPLQLKYERKSDTNVIVTLPVQPKFLNTLGVVNGAVLCMLADIAMGNACETFPAGDPNRQSVVTVDLKISFLSKATGQFLIADAHLLKRGKTLHYLDCFIYNDTNKLVAKASGIFANVPQQD